MNKAKDRIISFLIVLLGIGVILILVGTCETGEDGNGGSYEPKIPPHSRVAPATVTRQEYWGVKVYIDGTNEYEKDNFGWGHDTTVVLEPGQEVTIQYMRGYLTYRDTEKDGFSLKKKGPRTIGFSWGPNDLRGEEKVRYRDSGTANAFLIILRTNSGQEKFYTFGNHFKVDVINVFDTSARIWFFFNTKEYFYNDIGELESGFQYNGWDGSRAEIDIITIQMAGR